MESGATVARTRGVPRRPRTAIVAVVGIALIGAIATALPPVAATQEVLPDKAVFHLVVLRQDGVAWHEVNSGTGFFTGKDGAALTNAHVVYPAFRKPDLFKLLVMLDGVFFSADVVCATRLTHDPTAAQPAGARVERDLAEIRVKAPDTPFGAWVVQRSGREPVVVARKHEGPMPEFPILTLGGATRLGEAIRVLGFGNISAMPRRWSTVGTIGDHGTGDDGVQTFTMRFALPPQPGSSGSPVLNAKSQVAGLFTWYHDLDRTMGLAIAGSELKRPCRPG